MSFKIMFKRCCLKSSLCLEQKCHSTRWCVALGLFDNFAFMSFSVLVCLSVLTMSFPAPCADSAHLPGMLTCNAVLLSLLKKSGKVFITFSQEFLLRGPQRCGAEFLMTR
jgi:hypothetical protein